jgi:hypothetical protein
MFGLFKKKSKLEKLESKYKKLLNEAYKLSTINRSKSDAKTFEANEVLKEIEQIKKAQEQQ